MPRMYLVASSRKEPRSAETYDIALPVRLDYVLDGVRPLKAKILFLVFLATSLPILVCCLGLYKDRWVILSVES